MKWNGKAACIAWYREHPDEFDLLRQAVLNASVMPIDIVVAPVDEESYE